ncbi:hypothetical protein GCM10011583_72350 [Streptomyces camponoticapitis]|uniref:Carbohydrate kinase PfkB domain-containing protein n=1 Tax=Streptomyces camponoticapitis TaxID=1616125 RepID=A0ABQ2EZW0_9ACTN|nr:hypothetical protein GCM10011583_72350 [Streptomyces camponoticapitis]
MLWRPATGSPTAAACRADSTPRWYAQLVERAHAAGARIALDTSGASLLAALKERPDVVKPNSEELATAVSRPLATVGDALKAAEELLTYGAGAGNHPTDLLRRRRFSDVPGGRQADSRAAEGPH